MNFVYSLNKGFFYEIISNYNFCSNKSTSVQDVVTHVVTHILSSSGECLLKSHSHIHIAEKKVKNYNILKTIRSKKYLKEYFPRSLFSFATAKIQRIRCGNHAGIKAGRRSSHFGEKNISSSKHFFNH